MASSDPTLRAIEVAAKQKYPKQSQMDARFDERNRLRKLAGYPPEKRKRGGIAGVYDRNDHLIKPILIGAAAAAVPALLPAAAGASRLGPILGGRPSPSPSTGAPMLIASNNFAGGGLVGGILTAGREVLTSAAGAAINRFIGGGPPPLPSGFGGTPVPQPQQGVIGRTISRIIPGGLTGREFMPVNDMTDRVGRPIAVYPSKRESVVGPAGYVMVTMNGERIAMLRSFAIRAGLYTAPPKPPVSGYDMRAIKRAASAGKRVKKLAQITGFKVERKGARCATRPAFGRKK